MSPGDITIIVILVVFWIISGILSMDLHDKKGYSGGFWVGFLLGYIGLIYSAGLPDVRSKKVIKDEQNDSLIISEDKDDLNDNDPDNIPRQDECPNCFAKISKTDSECLNCGYKLK